MGLCRWISSLHLLTNPFICIGSSKLGKHVAKQLRDLKHSKVELLAKNPSTKSSIFKILKDPNRVEL